MFRFSLTFKLSFGKRKENDTDQEVIVKEPSKTPAQVPSKQSTEGRTTENLFRRHSDRLIDRTRKEGRASCAGNYGTAVRSFMKFLGREDIPVTQISSTLIKRYELWLRDNGISRNTSSCYMRSLRSLYNKVSQATHTRNRNPFAGVFTGNEKTVKRAVGEAAISKIAVLALPPAARLCFSRDLFLFSFYAMGMPFVDVVYLKKSQIKDNVLTYYRQKTGIKVQVQVESCMQDIMNRYSSPSSPYVFPILRAVPRACALSRDLFLFSFYAMGMPFIDVAHLKKKGCKRQPRVRGAIYQVSDFLSACYVITARKF
jgi:hypothetical protein